MTVTSSVHVCENVCDACGKCTNWNCYNCNDYRCKCLVITIGDNKFTATEGKWLHNTAITSSTAQNYQMIVFDKNYVGTFTTNGFGVALVINNEGQLVKAYDAANGDGTVYYYDANSDEVVIDVGGNANYATAAFAALKDGETLIIFPNDGGNNIARNWAKNLCANIGDNATLTTPAGLHKTIYFQNNWLWTDVKVYYWYEEAWYNISWPGVSPTKVSNDGEYDIYKIDFPSNATGLIISGIKNDGSGTRTQSVDIDTITNGYIYWCSYENNAKVELSANKYTDGYATHNIYLKGDFNNWTVEDAYRLTPSADGKTWTGTFTFDKTVNVKMFNTLIISGNGWINGEGYSTDVELAPGKYDFTYSTTNNTFTFNMTERKIYLKPTGWENGARFAAYVWNDNGNKWLDMTKESDGTYSCFAPVSYTSVIFGRMNSSTTANNWDSNNIWNQSCDLTIPTNGDNLWTVTTAYGGDNKSYGDWSRSEQ